MAGIDGGVGRVEVDPVLVGGFQAGVAIRHAQRQFIDRAAQERGHVGDRVEGLQNGLGLNVVMGHLAPGLFPHVVRPEFGLAAFGQDHLGAGGDRGEHMRVGMGLVKRHQPFNLLLGLGQLAQFLPRDLVDEGLQGRKNRVGGQIVVPNAGWRRVKAALPLGHQIRQFAPSFTAD